MAKELIQVPASVVGMNPRQDRSWNIKFETQELSGEDVKTLANNFQGEGWLVFSPNEIALKDVPTDTAEAGVKSPSQRLRAVIYILWQQRGGKGDFESFYRTYLGTLIEYVKSKLQKED